MLRSYSPLEVHERRGRSTLVQATVRWVLSMVSATACASSPPAANPNTSGRRPPGVVVDPRFTPPPARTAASASDDILTLQAPAGMTEAITLVDGFFRAIGRESGSELSELLTGSAVALFDNSTGTSALGAWRRRFAAFDYAALAAQPDYRRRDVEAFDARAAQRLRGIRELKLMPADDELLVVVRLSAAAPGLFGTHVHMLLTPGPDGYRVRATYEDFSLR